MAPLVRTGGSRHTGLAALPHRNIQSCQYARQLEGFIFSILVITGYKTVIPEEAII